MDAMRPTKGMVYKIDNVVPSIEIDEAKENWNKPCTNKMRNKEMRITPSKKWCMKWNVSFVEN